jgi:glycerol-3-phosphate dehydrogenase
MRSKGIHLIVPAVTRNDALTVAAGKGHFFVLPWREHSILGTTDTAFAGDPDTVGVGETDIESFLNLINAHLPAARLARSDVRHFYAGLRPLVDDGSGDTYGASRRAELIDHRRKDGVAGLLSAIGGKWTTSRKLAENVVDLAVRHLSVSVRRCSTHMAPLPGGKTDSLEELRVRTGSVPRGDHLARLYGSRLDGLLDLANSDSALREVLSPSGDIGAQVLFSIREEMAATLEDVVMRRTGIGQLGRPQPAALETAAALMARELGWNAARRNAEIAMLLKNFEIAGAGQ